MSSDKAGKRSFVKGNVGFMAASGGANGGFGNGGYGGNSYTMQGEVISGFGQFGHGRIDTFLPVLFC